ncbi:MAG: acetylxylan esterase [Armatimonadota bacterium]
MKSVSEELSTPGPPVIVPALEQPIEPIFPAGEKPTIARWERELRPALLDRWNAVIGKPSFRSYDTDARVVSEFETDYCRGTVLRQPTGPDQRQQVVLLEPTSVPIRPRPCAVVPYYHPDLMAGFELDTGEPISERRDVQFGRHLVRRGFVVACTEAFPFNTVPEPQSGEGFAWWRSATEKLLNDNPRWTGIGKLCWDTSRAVDLLLEQPDIDAQRVLAIGHSLGGKMAFYATAFDERITACIASDFGIAWDFTNWDAPWYFGEQIHAREFTLNGHHALALIAPRSFLMIAGEADRPESWRYIEEAQRVYRLYDRRAAAGCFLHMTGHQPTRESILTAYRWLAEQFGLPGF